MPEATFELDLYILWSPQVRPWSRYISENEVGTMSTGLGLFPSQLFWLWTSPVGLDRPRSTGRDVPRRLRDAKDSNEAVHAPSAAISSPCHSLRSPIRLWRAFPSQPLTAIRRFCNSKTERAARLLAHFPGDFSHFHFSYVQFPSKYTQW